MTNWRVIFGPPGTGKTTTLLRIVEKCLETTPPEKIAYLSFTKKAANEAITRAMAKFNLPKDSFPYFRTLHSLCFRQMGISSSDVFDGKKILEFGDWLGVEITGKINFEEGSTYGTKPGDRALFMYNLSRIRQKELRQQYLEDGDDLPWQFVDWVARGLDSYKRRHNLIDYTDMLDRFIGSSWKPSLDVVIIDEAQDLSPLQWQVVNRITDGARDVYVAGDDDQAIYRWAGADSAHMSGIRGTHSILTQSYRVPKSIQSVASRTITRCASRVIKDWVPRNDDGSVQRVGKFEQADYSSEDILILARNSSYFSDLQSMLKRRGIPYTYRGTPAISPTIMGAIEIYERLRGGASVDVDDARKVYGYTSRVKAGYKRLTGVTGPVDMAYLRNHGGLQTEAIWHEALDKLPINEKMFILTSRRNGEKLRIEPRVRLSTIHGAKGGEADHVILLTDMAPRTYREYEKHPDDEYRVWYVAVTRAKRQLTIVDSKTNSFMNLK